MARSSTVNARGGEGRHRGSAKAGGGFRSRCKEARETPRALQAATGPNAGTAWTASFIVCSRRCRPSPEEAPTATRLFLNINDDLGAGQPLRQMAVLLLQLTHFVEERIAFRLGTALAGSPAPVALLAPVRKMGAMPRREGLYSSHYVRCRFARPPSAPR